MKFWEFLGHGEQGIGAREPSYGIMERKQKQ
jgi:hypothetical protein